MTIPIAANSGTVSAIPESQILQGPMIVKNGMSWELRQELRMQRDFRSHLSCLNSVHATTQMHVLKRSTKSLMSVTKCWLDGLIGSLRSSKISLLQLAPALKASTILMEVSKRKKSKLWAELTPKTPKELYRSNFLTHQQVISKLSSFMTILSKLLQWSMVSKITKPPHLNFTTSRPVKLSKMLNGKKRTIL